MLRQSMIRRPGSRLRPTIQTSPHRCTASDAAARTVRTAAQGGRSPTSYGTNIPAGAIVRLGRQVADHRADSARLHSTSVGPGHDQPWSSDGPISRRPAREAAADTGLEDSRATAGRRCGTARNQLGRPTS